jgi:hypothetical protein
MYSDSIITNTTTYCFINICKRLIKKNDIKTFAVFIKNIKVYVDIDSFACDELMMMMIELNRFKMVKECVENQHIQLKWWYVFEVCKYSHLKLFKYLASKMNVEMNVDEYNECLYRQLYSSNLYRCAIFKYLFEKNLSRISMNGILKIVVSRHNYQIINYLIKHQVKYIYMIEKINLLERVTSLPIIQMNFKDYKERLKYRKRDVDECQKIIRLFTRNPRVRRIVFKNDSDRNLKKVKFSINSIIIY